ncbi:MaoC family dehydratase [Streptomyces sp. OR43]|uniref:MaoC family dehydratase n=1 Tax=Streptomyces sp. or43 TaxID=2478957 RepID=UPI001650DAF9|nr:cation:dicarboxylase symporter family transporter [Streptomyces sp. or43]
MQRQLADLDLIGKYATFTADVYIGCALVMFGVYPLLLATVAKVSPLQFFKGAWPAIQLAFVSRSSVGTMPVTQKVIDRLELTVYAEALTPHRRGTEVTVVTEARLADELVWESRSGYLSRHTPRTPTAPATPGPSPSAAPGPSPAAAPEPALPAAPEPALPAVAEWRLPADLGRRYGAASGDRNPIHLYPLTARLFDFPRAIAHGMWTVARCLAEAPQPDPAHSVHSVRADFRAPVLLPGTVTYASDGAAFQLRGDGGRVHLTGTTTPTAPEAATGGRS